MTTLPDHLDMGIWSEGGDIVWMPKQFYPERNRVKQWAVANDIVDHYIDVRVRTVWMHTRRGELDGLMGDFYIKCPKDTEGSFECWEIY